MQCTHNVTLSAGTAFVSHKQMGGSPHSSELKETKAQSNKTKKNGQKGYTVLTVQLDQFSANNTVQ